MRNFLKISLTSFLLMSCQQEPAKVEYHLNEFYGYNDLGESVAVLKTGEEVVGPEDIASNYKVDKYKAPQSVEVEVIDNLNSEEEGPQQPSEEVKYSRGTEVKQLEVSEPTETAEEKSSRTIDISEQTHIVEAGQTLYAISREYDIPILPIIIVNNLSEPYHLQAGQRIRIPKARFHVVGSQETLYSISRKYGVDMKALVHENRLSYPYDIEVGQKLQVPFPTYRPEPQIASESTKNISEPVKEASSNTGEIEMHTSEAEVLKPKGLSIMIPPTMKPVEERAPTYQTALLRKELDKKRIRDANYKDDGKFMWPTKGELTGKFGMQKDNEYNDGIYISAPAGSFVKASLSGKVVYTGDSLKSYGNLVIVKHDNGLLTAYAHLSKIDVKKDDFVKKGEVIGTVGQTGKVKSPQLYFAIRRGKEARDPMMYLR